MVGWKSANRRKERTEEVNRWKNGRSVEIEEIFKNKYYS